MSDQTNTDLRKRVRELEDEVRELRADLLEADPNEVCPCGCGRSLLGRRQTVKWATRSCSKKGKARPRMTADELALQEIVRYDPCSYCGRKDDHWRTGVGADHIVALSRGGEAASTNMTAACQFGNSSKQAHDLLGFLLGTCHVYGSPR